MNFQYRLSLFADRFLRHFLIIVPLSLFAVGVAVMVAG